MTGEMTTDPVPSVVEAIQAVMRDATDEQLRTIPQSASCNVAAVRADPVWWCPEHGTIYFQHSWDFSLRRHRRTTSCAAEMVNLVGERTERAAGPHRRAGGLGTRRAASRWVLGRCEGSDAGGSRRLDHLPMQVWARCPAIYATSRVQRGSLSHPPLPSARMWSSSARLHRPQIPLCFQHSPHAHFGASLMTQPPAR